MYCTNLTRFRTTAKFKLNPQSDQSILISSISVESRCLIWKCIIFYSTIKEWWLLEMNSRSTSTTPSACQDSGGCKIDAVRVGWKAGSKIWKESEGFLGFGGDCILAWTRKVFGKWRGGVFGWYRFGLPAKAVRGKLPIPHTHIVLSDPTLWRLKADLHVGFSGGALY